MESLLIRRKNENGKNDNPNPNNRVRRKKHDLDCNSVKLKLWEETKILCLIDHDYAKFFELLKILKCLYVLADILSVTQK